MDVKLDSCRICLQHECIKNIFEEQDNILISEKIVYCASVQVSQDDFLPKMICGQCLCYLEIAYTFRIECESTDRKIRRLFKDQMTFHEEITVDDKANYVDAKESVSKISFSPNMVTVGGNECSQYKALDETNYISVKFKQKENPNCKVGRHIAKKITGKLPQRLQQNITSDEKSQFSKNSLLNEVVLKDVYLGSKCEDDVILKFEELLESNVPMVVSEETVTTEDNFSYEIGSTSGDQGQENLINIDYDNLNLSSEKAKSKTANKKVKVDSKLKMTLRKGNRKVNVFRDHLQIRLSNRRKLKVFTEQLKNSETQVENIKKTKEGFKCDICYKLFPYRSHLKRHLNKHSGTKLFSCKFCKKEFVNNYNLNVHMSKHTGEFPLKCEICNKGLPNPSLLKRHMTSHTGEQKFQCRYCLAKFRQSSSLKSHEKMHLNRPSYHCDICFKVFSYTNSLSAHRKLHFGAQRFSCNLCLSTFSRKSSLVRHMAEHTKSKKVKCKFCALSFYSKNNYNAHLKTHCKYKCEVCSEGFKYKSNFNEHIKNHKN